VTGADAVAIGELAASLAITLHELSPRSASLEEVFLEATSDAQQYRGDGAPPPPPPPPPLLPPPPPPAAPGGAA
jgi:ABC-2 type transport system ATP-binding protein